jgi:polyamine oxidase
MRRRTFGMTLLSATAAVASGCLTDEPTRIPGPTRRVVVIGAGLAGLVAARGLVADGVEVVVVEARDRIGGRTSTIDLAGASIDAGAAWIHGRRGNPVAELCDSLGLTTRLHDYDYAWLWDDVAERPATPQELAAAAAAETALYDALPALKRRLGASASMQDAIDAYLATTGLDPTEARHVRFVMEQLLVEVDYGGPARRTSLANFDEDEFFGYDDHLPTGGYGKLTDALATSLDIRLNTPISRVEWDDGEARAVALDGTVFSGDRVIVTVPLGVLQAGTIEFSPPLPAAKREAIASMEMGSLEKVMLRFETRFWNGGQDLAWLHLGTARGEFPLILDLSHDTGQPTLILLHGGDRARQQLDERSDTEIVDDALAVLAKHFGPAIPAPIDAHVTRWRSDPWSLGSYTFPALGQNMADFDVIAEPVGQRVLFAGEATSRAYFGTAHGAVASARRELQRLGIAADAWLGA